MFGFLKVIKPKTAASVTEAFTTALLAARTKAIEELKGIEEQNRARANKLQEVIMDLHAQRVSLHKEADAAVIAQEVVSGTLPAAVAV
jgi:hypothetical protein